MLGVVTQVEQGIQAVVRFEPNVAALAAIAAGWASPRNKFLPSKCRHAIAAITSFDADLYTIDEHRFGCILAANESGERSSTLNIRSKTLRELVAG